ncbi:MAG TPA: hypothetical protein VFY68_15590 [Nitrososphaeraceae archaeon]|nr:hypothetical protein [Nitrososphaeraceae archaeon]
MAYSNGLRNMAHEINAFVKEARDVKVEYHNMNTQATIPVARSSLHSILHSMQLLVITYKR